MTNQIEKTRMARAVTGLFAVLALSSACLGAPPPAIAQASQPASLSASEYRLGSGDKLRIIVFGEAALSGEFTVSAEGRVSLPLIGPVDALGRTLPELQGLVETKLADGFLLHPRVNVEVLNYRPFYILGEVMKPGEYPFSAGLTVYNAVATAQGFTYRANSRRVYIKKFGETREEVVPLSPSLLVEPGDTIRIGERLF